jgi:hypothetical protein
MAIDKALNQAPLGMLMGTEMAEPEMMKPDIEIEIEDPEKRVSIETGGHRDRYRTGRRNG